MKFFKKSRKKRNAKLRNLLTLCGVGIALLFVAFIAMNNPLVRVAFQDANQPQAASVAYWSTQQYYNTGPHITSEPGYTSSLNYYPFPSPINCYLNFQSGGYNPDCTAWTGVIGGILSANIVGTNIGIFSNSSFSAGGTGCGGAPIGGYVGGNTSQPLNAAPGSEVEFDWSCQPEQHSLQYLACGNGWVGPSVNPIYTSAVLQDSDGNLYPSASWNAVVTQTNVFSYSLSANTQNLIGSTTVTVNWPQGTTKYFKLYCNTSAGLKQLNATVPITALTPPQPTLSITGNNQNPLTIQAGQSVTIAATFKAGTGDTLEKTAINDFQNNLWCGTGCTPSASMQTLVPLSSKSYTFTPTTAGSYVFYPAVETTYFPAWNNYGQSLTINVTAPPGPCQNGTGTAGSCTSCNSGYVPSGGNCVLQCPNGSGPTGSCSACNSGYTLQSGQCVAVSCPGAHQVNYPTCSCDVGYIMQGGSCVADTCSDPHAIAPSCNTCVSGYAMQGGVCTLIPPSLSISASASRVTSGKPATLTWKAQGLVAGAGTQCSVTSVPSGVFSQTMPAGTAPAWSGTNVQTGAVTGTTVFTLSCTGATPVSTTVELIPSYQEI